MFTPTKPDIKQNNDFGALRVRIASPEKIAEWSYGEILKPETINYRTFKPEKDGLFCAKIFGPVKDWECLCGKYKRMKHRGVVCEKCGVEVIESKVRRSRMGHIDLASPVAHIWFVKGAPSRVATILDLLLKDVERVIYFESYIITDAKDTELKEGELITDTQYNELLKEYDYNAFSVGIGAEAIQELLKKLDLETLLIQLKMELATATSIQKRLRLAKRLKVVESFRKSGNKPEWMIMDIIPVIPPELRPLVPLDGGRFATSDLNDLYRRVINRNNRLKKLMELSAPEIIIRNEKRMLQEAVDALLDNGRRGRVIRSSNKRPLKSLSDMIKGKQGRFRQNLLGKRVDYSGRSVIVAGPYLKLHQCGLPKNMALELFKPFLYYKLEKERGVVSTIKQAKKMVEEKSPIVWDILEEVIKEHPVLLNRAPTLHRLGIQAFEPMLVEGNAIQLHPLVCPAFNADFDGDQMAVHVPLSNAAQLEARTLMLSSYNILSPANGLPLALPTQDIILGIYYLTRGMDNAKGEGKIFASPSEVRVAYDQDALDLHAKIKVRVNGTIHDTITGRVILYGVMPEGIDFKIVNRILGKKEMGEVVEHVYKVKGNYDTVIMLDALKSLGFRYSTKAGFSICIEDFSVPERKYDLVADAEKKVADIEEYYNQGVVSSGERYNQIIELWQRTSDDISEHLMDTLESSGGDKSSNNKRDKFYNPIYVMAHSGARGSKSQILQLSGMRGLMAKPSGEIMETPITHNFREGLTVLQYFTSTHGARKGLSDTALKTASSGYLTRRLVDVAQDVIVVQEDCGTASGIDMTALRDGSDIIETLRERVYGRFTMDDVYHPETDELIIGASELITDDIADAIDSSGVETVEVRSTLTCSLEFGICQKCYGLNLGTRRLVEHGEAVGIISAQSIGEPGTQLTMRTFHIGGAASASVEASSISSKASGTVEFIDCNVIVNSEGKQVVLNRNGVLQITDTAGRIIERYSIPYASTLLVESGSQVGAETMIIEWDPYASVIISEYGGTVKYKDLTYGETVKQDTDPVTGRSSRVVTAGRHAKKQPMIIVEGESKGESYNYQLPVGAMIQVGDGDTIAIGDIIARMPKEAQKTRDITVGLPRVAELFEARKPKEPAIISEIDGVVSIENMGRGVRKVTVKNAEVGLERSYSISTQSYLNVHEGDTVLAGEALVNGLINPHDILSIKGERELQHYLLNEIQEVYRKQSVNINDKHVETILRQMLRKIVVSDSGDSLFMPDEEVYKYEFYKVCRALTAEGKKAPSGSVKLQGITKAALNTDSFISAASFQETTRVLTDAAASGRIDSLRGLKENVIMGRLIPAGTGAKHLHKKYQFTKNEEK